MSAVGDLIATIPATEVYPHWTDAEREACCQWLRANGLDPDEICVVEDIKVHILDCPAISYTVHALDPDTGHFLIRGRDELVFVRRTSLLRVPLPDPCPFPIHVEA